MVFPSIMMRQGGIYLVKRTLIIITARIVDDIMLHAGDKIVCKKVSPDRFATVVTMDGRSGAIWALDSAVEEILNSDDPLGST